MVRKSIPMVIRSTALAAAVMAFASPVLAQEWVDGKLQPLESGFPDRALVLMVVDEPGSHDSVYATQLVQAASKLSPVAINIQHREDFSSFGTWEALAWIKDQGELGNQGYISMIYTMPGAIMDLLVADMKREVGVDLDDLAAVIATEQVPYVMIQRADAPWGSTLEDLVAYAKENPGTLRHASGGPGAGLDTAMQVWIRKLGFTVNDIIGGSSGERALAVASGEADITVSPLDVLLPHFQAGRVTPLMAAGSNPVPEELGDIPNAAQLGMENDPFDSTRAIGVPATVPEENRKWLHELFKTAAQDPEFVAAREQVPGLVMLERDEAATRAVADSAYEAGKPIMQEMGVYWEDQ
jgi:tripartite-type tricarboxylate transporter receptor subunit TctC